HVHPGSGKSADLLGKGGAGFVEAGFAQRLETHAERTNGTGYPGFAGLLVFEVLDGLARQAHPGRVDFGNFFGESVTSEAKPVGAKGVGFKDICARLQVLLMNREDESGIRQVEFVIASVDKDAPTVQHSSHGSVGKQRTA